MEKLDYFTLSFLIAVLAFVYSYILSQPGEPFGLLNKWLYRFFENDKRMQEGKELHPLYKLLIGCEKCIAGQIALWCFLLLNYSEYTIKALFPHILFVSLTIFLTVIIKGLYKKTIQQWM